MPAPMFLSQGLDIKKGLLSSFNFDETQEHRWKRFFSRFAPEEYDYQFQKTKIMVKLLKPEYISCSEAKRLVVNLEKFREIELDFKGVSHLGQGFADDVFRVFANQYPGIAIHYSNANPAISAMLLHVKGRG